MRPFYFLVVLWGMRYAKYFTDWCLPSFLAHGNIPALKGTGHKFVIVCPREDWVEIESRPSMRMLERYAEPVHVPYPDPQPTGSTCSDMSRGHIAAVNYAFDAGARSVHLTPDMMISDGLLGTVQRWSDEGARVVLSLALRFAEEPMREQLGALGHRLDGTDRLAVPPRELARIGMASMHPETLAYEWGSEAFCTTAASAWVRAGDGMVCCGLSWAPILFDYGALPHHDISTLQKWTMDGDYVYRNFLDGPHIRQIRDTDDGLILSWTPQRRSHAAEWPKFDPRTGSKAFANWYHSKTFDPLKRRIFWLPVRWHPAEIGPDYEAAETRLLDDMARVLSFDRSAQMFVGPRGQALCSLVETPAQYHKRVGVANWKPGVRL